MFKDVFIERWDFQPRDTEKRNPGNDIPGAN